MSQLCPKIPDICRRVVVVRRYIRVLWERAFMNASAVCKPRQYQPLARGPSSAPTPSPAPYDALIDLSSVGGYGDAAPIPPPPVVVPDRLGDVKDSDLVSMKISLLGDRQTGKTSFLTKYVGNEKDHRSDLGGLGYTDKIQCVQGARLFFSIWEVGGNVHCQEDNIPAACRDSVAILFMFDLTSRRTLNSVIEWYQEARKWNQTAIPILIGTKFDDFVQLPIDLQWTIASQARRYAKALNATLFFSSSAYNINVNKVFKFITAKLFNLPWSVERNLTIGEPIIDF